MDRIDHLISLLKDLPETEWRSFWARADVVRAKRPLPVQVAAKQKPRAKKRRCRSHGKTRAKPEGLKCPHCQSAAVKGHGQYRGRSRFKCKSCKSTFNDWTNTPLSGAHSAEKMTAFTLRMGNGGMSIRDSADEVGVSVPTAFSWRHKILHGYSVAPSRKLKGIAEADDLFFLFSEKGDKTVSKRRAPRKRGGVASKPGISDEQVPVLFGCDREGELILARAGRGQLTVKEVEGVLGGRVDPNATLCIDSNTSLKAFAKANEIHFKALNASKGQRVIDDVYHIQHVNGAHSRFRKWMKQFNGVSTKHLNSYAQWFGLLEETKARQDRADAFVARSARQRRCQKPQTY